MSGIVYLLCLLTALACMVLLDRRFGLALWRAPRRAVAVLLTGIALFLVWDLAAIASGHYRMGDSPLMSGVELGPELPLEELVFLTFLCHLTLVLWGLLDRLLGRRRHATAGKAEA
ncbi:lycopene cyclase domain-containing protein [Brachybacterium paraconglomeratum]|uniref:lycopene cyclase domain-containing protein n=1 Tax=Brachybacterium paraconglomeratum TaxID=173362 RepID=UPI003FD3E7C7